MKYFFCFKFSNLEYTLVITMTTTTTFTRINSDPSLLEQKKDWLQKWFEPRLKYKVLTTDLTSPCSAPLLCYCFSWSTVFRCCSLRESSCSVTKQKTKPLPSQKKKFFLNYLISSINKSICCCIKCKNFCICFIYFFFFLYLNYNERRDYSQKKKKKWKKEKIDQSKKL